MLTFTPFSKIQTYIYIQVFLPKPMNCHTGVWLVGQQHKKTEREKISAVQKDPLLFACHFGFVLHLNAPNTWNRLVQNGWILAFFACLWTKMNSRSKNLQRKNEANIQPSCPLEQAWSVKDYYMAFGEILLTGHSRQSRLGKIVPSFLLRQPITVCDFAVHLTRLQSQLYNKCSYYVQRGNCMDLLINTATILNFIVSNSYCGMLRGHRHTHLSSEHPTMSLK